VQDAVVLDLFAGTGALGLEALSRGAAYAVFLDRSAAAVALIRRAVTVIGIRDVARVIRWDIGKSLSCIRTLNRATERRLDAGCYRLPVKYDLVFMDPPYHRDLVSKALHHLHQGDVLSEDALIVAEHAATEDISEDAAGFALADHRVYGSTAVSFLTEKQKQTEAECS